MSSPESYNAVCETTGDRDAGAGPPVADSTRLSGGEALAGGVLPASSLSHPAGRVGDHGADAVVAEHGRWGFWKCFDRLRLQGHAWNHKRVHRVYCALRLNLPRRTKCRVPHRLRRPLVAPPVLNQTWALDFMVDALYDRRRFRLLTIMDEGNREALAIEVGTSIPAPRVTRVVDELIALHGRPAAVRVDNGPELLAQVFVDWCDARGIVIQYIQPGKPDQNAYIERFNRSYRTEILDAYVFESLAEVRALTERWLVTYNHERPHDSLGRVPPLTFLPRPTSAGQSPFGWST
jgi:putative transposase